MIFILFFPSVQIHLDRDPLPFYPVHFSHIAPHCKMKRTNILSANKLLLFYYYFFIIFRCVRLVALHNNSYNIFLETETTELTKVYFLKKIPPFAGKRKFAVLVV